MDTYRSVVALGLGADEATRAVVDALADRSGLAARRVSIGRVAVTRTVRPRWATIACLLTCWLFGLGLLFLLVRRTDGGEVLVVEGPRGAIVTLPPLLGRDEERAVVDAVSGRSAAEAEPAPAPRPSHTGDLDAPTVGRPERAPGAERPSRPPRPDG